MLQQLYTVCKFGNVYENLIYAKIRELVALQIQDSR